MPAPVPIPRTARHPCAARIHRGCSGASTGRTASPSSAHGQPPSAMPRSGDRPVAGCRTAPTPGIPHRQSRSPESPPSRRAHGSPAQYAPAPPRDCETDPPQPADESSYSGARRQEAAFHRRSPSTRRDAPRSSPHTLRGSPQAPAPDGRAPGPPRTPVPQSPRPASRANTPQPPPSAPAA